MVPVPKAGTDRYEMRWTSTKRLVQHTKEWPEFVQELSSDGHGEGYVYGSSLLIPQSIYSKFQDDRKLLELTESNAVIQR